MPYHSPTRIGVIIEKTNTTKRMKCKRNNIKFCLHTHLFLFHSSFCFFTLWFISSKSLTVNCHNNCAKGHQNSAYSRVYNNSKIGKNTCSQRNGKYVVTCSPP